MNRPYLHHSFLHAPQRHATQSKTTSSPVPQIELNSLPVHAQEFCMMEELLNAMMGFDGKHIVAEEQVNGVIKFVVKGAMDPSIADIVNRILPICDKYLRVNEYIQEHFKYEHGVVAHAFCATLKTLIKV